jgi:hypothetical protein
VLAELFDEPETVKYWTNVFDDMHDHNGRNAWDYQWLYTHLKNNALTIIPHVNLMSNIGFGPGATHTTEANPALAVPASAMEFPLRHPSSFIPLRSMDRHIQNISSIPWFKRITGRIRRVLKRVVRSF